MWHLAGDGGTILANTAYDLACTFSDAQKPKHGGHMGAFTMETVLLSIMEY